MAGSSSLPAEVGRQILQEGIIQEELGQVEELREAIRESGGGGGGGGVKKK